jgi:hypothetical protein
MKRRMGWVVLTGILIGTGCAHPSGNGLTTIKVFGENGAPVHGYFVQSGYRIPLEGALPITLARENLTELEVFKQPDGKPLHLVAQNDYLGGHYEVTSQASDGVSGLRLHVSEGLCVEKLTP